MFVFKFVGTMVMLMGMVVGSMYFLSSVIDINEKGIYRAPFVKFKAHDGKYYRFLSQFDRNVDFFDLKKGQKIDIIYERENPKRAQENNFWARYGPRGIPAAMGGTIFLIGLFVFTRGRKK